MAAKSDGEDEAGEFPFKCHQRLMAWCYWVAEERHRVLALEENGAKPIDGGIALHDEGLLEVGEGKYEHWGDCLLEGGERPVGSLCPGEPLFF